MSENNQDKTHFRKAFKSPYLSSADIEEPIILTVSHARLELDKTKRTKDLFNTVYFTEREIRPGEPLKPMIFNATNSKEMRKITGSGFLEDWSNARITVYVNPSVMNRGDIVEGLRIRPAPKQEKIFLTPEQEERWNNAKKAYKRDGNLDKVLERMSISEEHQQQLIAECNNEMAQHPTE